MPSLCGNGRRVGSTPAHGRVFMAMDSVPSIRHQATDTMTARLADPDPGSRRRPTREGDLWRGNGPHTWGSKPLVSSEHCVDVDASFVAEVGQRQTKASKGGRSNLDRRWVDSARTKARHQSRLSPGLFPRWTRSSPESTSSIAPGESLQKHPCHERAGLKVMI